MGWADPFYPDPSVPETVKEALIEAAQCGIASHYTMPIGSVELREEIAKKCKAYNHLDVDPRRTSLHSGVRFRAVLCHDGLPRPRQMRCWYPTQAIPATFSTPR